MAKCTFDPRREVKGAMGMFHCPECGEMILAGVEHPDYSLLESPSPIKYAAIKLRNNTLALGKTHAEIIKSIISKEAEENLAVSDLPVSQDRMGFVTTTGEFLDRKEAYKRAVLCKQIVDDGYTQRLISEMLE